MVSAEYFNPHTTNEHVNAHKSGNRSIATIHPIGSERGIYQRHVQFFSVVVNRRAVLVKVPNW